MNTAFLLLAQYGGKAIIPIDDLCRGHFFHLTPTKLKGEIAAIVLGADADRIVVDGDPLAEITLLQADGAAMPLIMRGGKALKDRHSSQATVAAERFSFKPCSARRE